jgi:cysteinyl-tRNA synthetase
MALQLFNTLSRSVVPFEPLNPGSNKLGLYCCGPTVHNFAHIGNFRTFVCGDFVRRYLTFRGYEVRHVMNITDVEDKIIAAVRKSGRALKDYTAEYEQAFLEDFDALNCLRPNDLPHATDFVAEIIQVIEALIQHGFAYRANDGSVYFSIEKYRAAGRKYGQLLNLKFEELRVGERVSADEYAKEAAADFALWKARVPEDGPVFWPSPWGEGRPGWHIECSAMSMKILGPSFDLHLGGEDLIFPHHEDEIAQSEGSGAQSTGRPFVKHWLHIAHLLVEGRKMSKSLGNYFTLRDLLQKGFTGREIRYLLLSSHYRESFNFTLDGLAGTRSALARIDELLGKIRELAGGQNGEPDGELLGKVTAALDDDLNVAAAWGHIFDWVRNTNRELSEGKLTPQQAAEHLAVWERTDSIFGVGVKAAVSEVPPEFLALLERRETARKAKDFKRADEIRKELKAKGWVIEDTPKGPKLKKL